MSELTVPFDIILEDYLPTFGYGRLSVVVRAPASASEVTFTGFGLANRNAPFMTSWSMSIHVDSEARFCLAFFSGTLRYQRQQSGAHGVTLENGDFLGDLMRQPRFPDWFPNPRYVVYTGIDLAETRAKLEVYLNDHPDLIDSILAVQDPPYDPASGIDKRQYVLDAFFDGTLTAGLSVASGDVVGVAGFSAGPSLREITVEFRENLDPDDPLRLDPAIYHLHWASDVQGLAGHPLETHFKTAFAGPLGNGRALFVESGGAASGDFSNSATPADSLATALAAAGDHDTIVFLDQATYPTSGTVTIDKPISVTALEAGDVIASATPALPTLDGGGSHRVLYVQEVAGLVALCNLGVTRGVAGTGTGAEPQSGGGIVVERHHATYLRNCHIHGNQAKNNVNSDVTDIWALDEELVADEGFGGGLSLRYASVVIYRNRFNDNRSQGRGGALSCWGYGWPRIEGNVFRENEAGGARADGGAIGIEVAYPEDNHIATWPFAWWDPTFAWDMDRVAEAQARLIRIVDNEIAENIANDDGGGVYLTVLARAQFQRNRIHSNEARRSGGGIRATLGSEILLRDDEIRGNKSNSKHLVLEGDEGAGGGGISLRNSSLSLSNCRVTLNTATGWAGGGLLFSSTDEGNIGFGISYNDILRTVFGVTKIKVTLQGPGFEIENNIATRINATQTDHRKGGGVYGLRYFSASPRFDSLPLEVTIRGLSQIANNTYGGVFTGQPEAFPDAADLYIEGMAENLVIDDSNKYHPDYTTGDELTRVLDKIP